MNVRRLLFAVGGVLCLGLGLLAGDVGAGLVSDLVDALGSDYALVAAVGGGVLLLAIPVVVAARAANLHRAETPSPEEPTSTPPPGREFDETIRSWRFRLPVVGTRRRREVRDRLEAAAVSVVMRSEGCDRETARERVRRGDWTERETAAAYLSSDRSVGSAVVDAADALVRGEMPTERRARVTADAIAARESRGRAGT